MNLHDKFGRQITDLRISVTDRSNFRCVYCRSADPENYRDPDEILSWPELDRLARVFLGLANRKIRLPRADRGVKLLFIESMPWDAARHWSRNLVGPAAEIHQRIHARWPLQQIPHERSETARKYRFADGAPGEIGLIAPVTQPFCGHCSRIRLTADGKLRTCLFSKEDHDLRALVREGASDEDLVTYIRSVVVEKEEGHRINAPDFVPPNRTMVFIGG